MSDTITEHTVVKKTTTTIINNQTTIVEEITERRVIKRVDAPIVEEPTTPEVAQENDEEQNNTEAETSSEISLSSYRRKKDYGISDEIFTELAILYNKKPKVDFEDYLKDVCSQYNITATIKLKIRNQLKKTDPVVHQKIHDRFKWWAENVYKKGKSKKRRIEKTTPIMKRSKRINEQKVAGGK